MIDDDGYRPNVGIVICNRQGEVLWARRYGQHSWQFPQGGINPGETAEQAMYRELIAQLDVARKLVEIDAIILDIDADDDGRVTVATALRGVSNGDGSEIQLFGNAVIVREATKRPDGTAVPRMEFRGEYLHAFVNEDRVSSDKPVELLRGADRFVGDQFDYDNRTGVAVLKGRVRGVLQPAK